MLDNDQKIYIYFQTLASRQGLAQQLQEYYESFFAYDTTYEERFVLYQKLMGDLQFTSQSLPYAEIISNFKRIALEEKQLKEHIASMLQSDLYQEVIDEAMRTNLEQYLSKDWLYFEEQTYHETALSMLFDAINNFQYLNHRGYFLIKKRLLDFQVGLEEK